MVEWQDEADSVDERLDRYCANSNWSTLFPDARVTHMFLWRACSNAQPLKEALGKRVPSIDAKCDLCSELTKSDYHAMLECMQAKQIWMASPFFDFAQSGRFGSVVEAFDIFKTAHLQYAETFVVILWTIWRSRNKLIRSNSAFPPQMALRKALNFVHEYKEAVDHLHMPWDNSSLSIWVPPTTGLVKVNFDGAKLRDWERNGERSEGMLMATLTSRRLR
ncbi:hypothetical protein Cgig2_008539 [Carnegiea gigantea]|uniref:Reverse transcriptase zinc-binding domain-containing protein n=1 Tax=Carnegiea gigantea TaxID=171969 RepID=A0A9Q1Q9E9_9CARY|nr:hypothetical protein Cgig2_008539 [Carnegiea gigantea]